ncbi:MAG: ABC transporter permease, partial [Alistipes sp.]|nr:ABC transporter permease [Alistipes sp.]
MKKLLLIIGREYFERVRNKSFIIVTLLMPLFMIGIMVAPSLMMLYGGKSEQKRVMVVDRSGMVVDKLYSSPEVEFVDVSELTKSEACAQYGTESDAFGVLYIGSVV